jgi:hypothetical protein
MSTSLRHFPSISSLPWGKTASAVVTASVLAVTGVAPAQAFSFGSISGSLSAGCPTNSCVDLISAGYNATGGAIVDPAFTKPLHYREPGTHFGDEEKVDSYHVTSALDDPTGAINPIEVTDLAGAFDFYWGSVDTYNIVEFWDSTTATLLSSITGYDLAGTSDWFSVTGKTQVDYNSGGNYGKDVYAAFTGQFDKVVLKSVAGDVAPRESGIAFEVAAPKDVPEPTGLVGLLGLAASFGVFRRTKANA